MICPKCQQEVDVVGGRFVSHFPRTRTVTLQGTYVPLCDGAPPPAESLAAIEEEIEAQDRRLRFRVLR